MGNETVRTGRLTKNNKNSFSVDFGHELPSKIRPNNNTLKLMPISQSRQTSPRKPDIPELYNQSQAQIQLQSQRQNNKRQAQQLRKQSNARLTKLNGKNDELRKQLIRISTELTQKLKKKKFEVKKILVKDINENKKQSLKKQLQNAYKQIDMYKKLISDLKINQHAQSKLQYVQDKINAVDIEIGNTLQQIQAIKNVTSNQQTGIRKDRSTQALQQLKNQIQALKLAIKQKSKQQRVKQKKYMMQHKYMKTLQQKLKAIQLQDEKQQKNIKNENKQESPTLQDIAKVQQQVEQLKIKHDQYHKKINGYLIGNKVLRENKKLLKQQLQGKNKIIEGLKYKRDAFVKQIKDNLHLFVTRIEQKQEQLSEFQSQQQEEPEPDPIQQEQDQRGTFDVEHLKDHQLKNISKQAILNRKQSIKQQIVRAQPKHWKKQLTRIISKGNKMPDQKPFETGLKTNPVKQIKIIKMNVWMNKKKQILSIQPTYIVDGIVIDGNKSSNNLQDEYRVSFQLEQNDFLKSILGIFGKSGFLQYLVLQSNNGMITKIGRQKTDGDNFAIGVCKQETPVKITGANRQDSPYWRINRLDFQVLFESGQ